MFQNVDMMTFPREFPHFADSGGGPELQNSRFPRPAGHAGPCAAFRLACYRNHTGTVCGRPVAAPGHAGKPWAVRCLRNLGKCVILVVILDIAFVISLLFRLVRNCWSRRTARTAPSGGCKAPSSQSGQRGVLLGVYRSNTTWHRHTWDGRLSQQYALMLSLPK